MLGFTLFIYSKNNEMTFSITLMTHYSDTYPKLYLCLLGISGTLTVSSAEVNTERYSSA